MELDEAALVAAAVEVKKTTEAGWTLMVQLPGASTLSDAQNSFLVLLASVCVFCGVWIERSCCGVLRVCAESSTGIIWKGKEKALFVEGGALLVLIHRKKVWQTFNVWRDLRGLLSLVCGF